MKKSNYVWLCLFIPVYAAISQTPPGPPGDFDGDDPLPVPIDSFLIVLLLVGIVYVHYKLKAKKNEIK